MSMPLTTALNSTSAGFSSSLGLLAGNARARETEQRFASLVDGINAGRDHSSSTDELQKTGLLTDTRLPGDFISSMAVNNPNPADYHAAVTGEAANSGQTGTIDKTSKLYEQALELESFFVKMMLSSMRNTVTKTSLSGDSDFASKMYDDMLYDELSRSMTKSAGFGLADQVYLQLADK